MQDALLTVVVVVVVKEMVSTTLLMMCATVLLPVCITCPSLSDPGQFPGMSGMSTGMSAAIVMPPSPLFLMTVAHHMFILYLLKGSSCCVQGMF